MVHVGRAHLVITRRNKAAQTGSTACFAISSTQRRRNPPGNTEEDPVVDLAAYYRPSKQQRMLKKLAKTLESTPPTTMTPDSDSGKNVSTYPNSLADEGVGGPASYVQATRGGHSLKSNSPPPASLTWKPPPSLSMSVRPPPGLFLPPEEENWPGVEPSWRSTYRKRGPCIP